MNAATAIANLVTPFMLQSQQVRGRIVRLGEAANTILSRYDYPPAVVGMLGELLTVAAMLGANLKQDGILTIQVRGKGIVPLMVVDATFGGNLRGYAEVSDEAKKTLARMDVVTPQALVGEGAYLAVTLDPGADMQRYQGIVTLDGNSVADALLHYFANSEQLDVELKLAVSPQAPWVAAGIIVERMPGEKDVAANEEAWRYAKALMGTVKAGELLDPMLDAPAMLYRLFHEEGVIVYDAQEQKVGCRCTRVRIEKLLMSMRAEDRADMIVDGRANVHCQFCNKSEFFTPAELGLSVN